MTIGLIVPIVNPYFFMQLSHCLGKNTIIPPSRQGSGEQGSNTIAVAMSGGVDSSVAAALLKEQGFKVVGFFMKNWADTYGLKDSECPWVQDREDAMRAAAKLDIPFHTLDFEKEYKEQVLDYFFREYQAGRTPNPDVMCNSQIKFGVFLGKAIELGADMIATGHYARLRREGQLPAVSCQLLKGRDQNKDQSYFLYRLNQEQLLKSIFPIGELEKPKVRELAKKFSLPNHDKRDSQGVCFVGHLDLQKFLKQKIKEQPGDIVTAGGKKVGEHEGLFWYTIGQRKGIKVGGVGPFYVVKKDFEKNELVVSNNHEDERLYSKEATIEDVHWIDRSCVARNATADVFRCEARMRYREPLSVCEVKKAGEGQYRIAFKDPQWAVASGQSIVLYDKDVCLGGGIVV